MMGDRWEGIPVIIVVLVSGTKFIGRPPGGVCGRDPIIHDPLYYTGGADMLRIPGDPPTVLYSLMDYKYQVKDPDLIKAYHAAREGIQ